MSLGKPLCPSVYFDPPVNVMKIMIFLLGNLLWTFSLCKCFWRNKLPRFGQQQSLTMLLFCSNDLHWLFQAFKEKFTDIALISQRFSEGSLSLPSHHRLENIFDDRAVSVNKEGRRNGARSKNIYLNGTVFQKYIILFIIRGQNRKSKSKYLYSFV